MIDYYDGVKILRNKTTKEPVGIEWRMDDGKKTRYYPEDTKAEWFISFVNDVKEELTTLRRHRYHCLSMDAFDFEGLKLASCEKPDDILEWEEETHRVKEFLKTLSEKQLFYLSFRLKNPHISLRGIGRATNKSATAVKKAFSTIKEKYKSFIQEYN